MNDGEILEGKKKRRPKPGQPPFEPTDEQRERVAEMVAVGITYQQIAAVIGIAENTLTKHFAHELATAKAEANAKVGKSLFVRAVNGDTAAAIWWTKAQMGWKEKKEVDQTVKVTLESDSEDL